MQLGGRVWNAHFPGENSFTGHELILPLGSSRLNSAVPNPSGQFEEQLPILKSPESHLSQSFQTKQVAFVTDDPVSSTC